MFSKPSVESFQRIDVATLKRLGFFKPNFSSNLVWSNSRTGKETGRIGVTYLGDRFRLRYRSRANGSDWEQIDEMIYLSQTYPNFGGSRNWLNCPSCGKRRGALYGGKYFRCRVCRGACYETQLEDAQNRSLTRLHKRRWKYGGEGNFDEPFPPKTKWMRWKTYNALVEADEEDKTEMFALTRIWLDGLKKGLGPRS